MVLEGWDGYQKSLVAAVAPLTEEQLAFRPTPGLRSVGEVVRHICMGRTIWFYRMAAPGSAEVATKIDVWETDSDGNRNIVEGALDIATDAALLVQWLEATWAMIDATLRTWRVSDLATTWPDTWGGRQWAISRQWTLFRVLAHDIHHGGELALMLGIQGIEPFELGALGGHIVIPPEVGG
jgi:uncharacterized damage-inducible protein DinB